MAKLHSSTSYKLGKGVVRSMEAAAFRLSELMYYPQESRVYLFRLINSTDPGGEVDAG